MRRTLAALLLLLAATSAAGEIVFVNVNLITMVPGEKPGPATVVVRDGRVATIATGPIPPRGGARVIDGGGGWLIPGLSDMHVHLHYEEELLLLLANGVTRTRNLWGNPRHLLWKREIAAGKRLGPTLFTSGPILDGANPVWQKSRPVASTEKARELVAELQEKGYDEIKVYNRLRRDVYRAILSEARTRGIRVTGHVPYAAGIVEALNLGQSCVEHLDGYLEFPFLLPPQIDSFVDLTARTGAWNCPTLVVYRKVVAPPEARALLARPEMRFVPPRRRAGWDPARDFRFRHLTSEQFGQYRSGDRVRKRVAKMLHDATGRLLLGTDAGNPFVVAGWSVHEELENLVDAGLTPYEAIEAGTTNAARYLGDGAGTIAKGERADLVLLEKNPLDDIANSRTIAGVMVRGRWLDRAEIDERLEGLVKSYSRPKDRFAGMAPLPEGERAYYKVSFNGLVVGEERFSVSRLDIFAQRVNDPPFDARTGVRFTMDERGYIISLTAVRDDPVFGKKGATLKRTPGVFYGFPSLATWISVERHFRGLENGASRTIDYHEMTLEGGEKITRIPVEVRRESEREYTVWMRRKDATYKSRLVVDRKGWPVTFTTELQQGTVEFERRK